MLPEPHAEGPVLDVLLRNARIIDGSGNPWYRGDVGIQGEKIVAVGPVGTADAARTIDCGDRIVSPGFIDMHSHSDAMLLAEPRHESKIFQGCTTDVLGQDGLSYAPVSPKTLQMLRRHLAALNGNPDIGWDWTTVASYLARFDQKVSANVALLVPHCAVRAEVLDMEDRLPTPAELDRMCQLVDEGMADGAVGFATGLDYTPQFWSDTDEIVALCKVVARRGGIYVTHVRYSLGDGVMEPVAEAIEIGRRSGVRVQISHLRGDRLDRPYTPSDIVGQLERARAEGVDVTFDNYPYTRGSTLLHSRLPTWTHVGGPEALLLRLHDPAQRQRIERELAEKDVPWDKATIASVSTEAGQRLEGWSIAEAANESGKPVESFICDILIDTDLGVSFVSQPTSSEESVSPMLAHYLASSGSDGLCVGSRRHPRTYGSFARVLGHYVREQRAMPLEDAVRKMTSACALRLGMKDRGLVREGLVADLAVWDDRTIAARSTYEDPLRTATGVSYVFVSGQLVLDDGKHTGATPGRALKPLLA
ncbi:MAG: D-aminoacylase [Chloroflexi bacterium]|nr:D-aminoacylase [Chloroflexota bacterium]